MVYQWKEGAKVSAKADVVGKCLEVVEQKHGMVTPENVVQEARRPRSVLHPLFEWNDGKAATLYREDQARYIIRSLVVMRDTNQEEPVAVRAFVHVLDEAEDAGYVNTDRALENDGLRNQVLKQALRELQAFQRKYGELKELARVFRAINTVKIAV